MRHEESILQQNCVTIFKLKYPLYLIISIKNSSKMGGKKIRCKNGKEIPLEAIIAKKEGVLAGMQVLFGNGTYNSLFIECKSKKGKQSEEQIMFEDYCNRNKFKYVIIRTVEEFLNEVDKYFKNEA
ncbi:MAG: hypothetical protein IPK62_17105 [Bacteroidetes bacterium]|nr:hypothetical protein [Bacteroidota bacterium]